VQFYQEALSMNDKEINKKLGDLIIYQNEKGETKIDAYFSDDTIWMTQKSLSILYQVSIKTINEHILNIYQDGELRENSTIRKFRIVQKEGSRNVERDINHYNLQMIFSIGYRVRNNIGIHFRNWATSILEEYTKKGFVINDERLKNPQEFGKDYFDELLARIRDIRSSEKRFYSKVKDIFATSIDYDKNSEQAQLFFKTIQNKLHYASHGHTAAEIIAERADATKDNMGLTSFKGAKVRKQDVTIAKNYLTADELDILNRIVTMYLDYAELQAKSHRPMYMNDWESKLDDFLRFNGRELLHNAGTIAAQLAIELAEAEYNKYSAQRVRIGKDIDELTDSVKQLKKKEE